MKSLREDILESSRWLIATFKSLNKDLDYSIESVKIIDNFLDEQIVDGKPKEGGVLFNSYGSKVFAIGCYIGDTIIKNTRAVKWEYDEQDEQVEINIRLVSVNGTNLWPVQRVMKRIKNGREDELYAYVFLAVNDYLKYDGDIPSDFSIENVQASKPKWKFWK